MVKRSVHLPGEIIEDILLRSPVKSLVRFRCVSKPWGCLISSERFMKSHLQISSKTPPQVILYRCCSDVLSRCSVESFLEEICSPQFERPMGIPLMRRDFVVGSCNGLVCIYRWYGGLILWNPSMEIYKKLPEIECKHDDMSFGFGWDESSDDYKVFAFSLDWFKYLDVCKVYSSKTNSWKTIEIPDFYLKKIRFSNSFSFMVGTFVDGKLHWYAASNEIVCFDLKSEMIGTMECPSPGIDDTLGTFLTIGVVAGCLSLISMEDKPQVWVMKEYGVKESWQKLSTLSHVRELLEPPFSAPFVVGPNSEIMLFHGSTFVVYHPHEHVFCHHFNATETEAHTFIQTFVSPGVDDILSSPSFS